MIGDYGFCEAHLERTGEKIPIYKLGLCEQCYRGYPINVKREMLGSRLGVRKEPADEVEFGRHVANRRVASEPGVILESRCTIAHPHLRRATF